jgi:hypothetical protein
MASSSEASSGRSRTAARTRCLSVIWLPSRGRLVPLSLGSCRASGNRAAWRANVVAAQLRSLIGAAGANAAAVTSWIRQLQRLVGHQRQVHCHASLNANRRAVLPIGARRSVLEDQGRLDHDRCPLHAHSALRRSEVLKEHPGDAARPSGKSWTTVKSRVSIDTAKLSGALRENSTRTPFEQPTLSHSGFEHPLRSAVTGRTSLRIRPLNVVVPQRGRSV